MGDGSRSQQICPCHPGTQGAAHARSVDPKRNDRRRDRGAARARDVAIEGDRIVAIGSDLPDTGSPVFEATGLLVTPEWVDIHSHYDGQATWDDLLTPSAWHGVTTVVMGNCGVGFAPESVPSRGVAHRTGWKVWRTFPVPPSPREWIGGGSRSPSISMPSVDAKWAMDVGAQIAHGAVRAYVMGDRGARNEPATATDIDAMREIVPRRRWSTGGRSGSRPPRTIAHRAIDGEPVPGTYTAEDELFGIGEALGDLGAGVFELAPAGVAGEDVLSPAKEVDWMRRLSAKIKRPVTYALVRVDAAPELWRELMDMTTAAVAEGADLWPQVAGRATGLLSGHFTTYCIFDVVPAYQELKAQKLTPTTSSARFGRAIPTGLASLGKYHYVLLSKRGRVCGPIPTAVILHPVSRSWQRCSGEHSRNWACRSTARSASCRAFAIVPSPPTARWKTRSVRCSVPTPTGRSGSRSPRSWSGGGCRAGSAVGRRSGVADQSVGGLTNQVVGGSRNGCLDSPWGENVKCERTRRRQTPNPPPWPPPP